MMSSHQETTVTAWARLMRAQQSLLARVEADLKKSGLPPLRWYDVLLELNRAGSTGLRQYELGAQLLLSKYNLSRLIDRLQKERLVDRQACAEDGRGARVRITDISASAPKAKAAKAEVAEPAAAEAVAAN